MVEEVKFVTMKHTGTGAVIEGVHPLAVPAHEAIGYEVQVDEPVKKSAPGPVTEAEMKGLDTTPPASTRPTRLERKATKKLT